MTIYKNYHTIHLFNTIDLLLTQLVTTGYFSNSSGSSSEKCNIQKIQQYQKNTGFYIYYLKIKKSNSTLIIKQSLLSYRYLLIHLKISTLFYYLKIKKSLLSYFQKLGKGHFQTFYKLRTWFPIKKLNS